MGPLDARIPPPYRPLFSGDSVKEAQKRSREKKPCGHSAQREGALALSWPEEPEAIHQTRETGLTSNAEIRDTIRHLAGDGALARAGWGEIRTPDAFGGRRLPCYAHHRRTIVSRSDPMHVHEKGSCRRRGACFALGSGQTGSEKAWHFAGDRCRAALGFRVFTSLEQAICQTRLSGSLRRRARTGQSPPSGK